MEKFNSFYIDSFPLKGAEKMDDIIYYDMPILSRYTFNGRIYLYYHVDDEDKLDTYIVFKISEYDLFKLISGYTPLRDTILNVDDFVYLIDINYSNEIVKTAQVYSNEIIDAYLPDMDSSLEIKFAENSYYNKLTEKYKPEYYTEVLRKNAFYLKFSSKLEKYGDTLGFDELAEKILPSIKDAYSNYTKFDFINKFKETFTDPLKLNRVFKRVSDDINLRVVDLHFGSFEIGVAPDTLMHSGSESPEINSWIKNVSEDFKNDVLEIDLNNSVEFEKVVSKFNDEQRIKIFKPIIDLANDKNINFLYKDKDDVKYKKIKKPREEIINRLIPKKEKELPKEKEFQLLQATVVVEKGKKPTLNLTNSLFSSLEEYNIKLTTETFKKYNYKLKLNKDIQVLITSKIDTGSIVLSANYDGEEFNSKLETTNLDLAIENLVKRIYEYHLNKTNSFQ